MVIYNAYGSVVSGNFSAFSNMEQVSEFLDCDLAVFSNGEVLGLRVNNLDCDECTDCVNAAYILPSSVLVKLEINGDEFFISQGTEYEQVRSALSDETGIDKSRIIVDAAGVRILPVHATVSGREESYWVEIAGAPKVKVSHNNGNAFEILAKGKFGVGFNFRLRGVTYDNIANVPELHPGETLLLVQRLRGNAASTTVYFMLAGTAPASVAINEAKSIADIINADTSLSSRYKNGGTWKYKFRVDGTNVEPDFVINADGRESVAVILTEVIKGNEELSLAEQLAKAFNRPMPVRRK